MKKRFHIKEKDYKLACVYIIECVENNIYYVGSTKNYNKRVYQHVHHLENNKHPNIDMQKDYNNKCTFKFYIIKKLDNNNKTDLTIMHALELCFMYEFIGDQKKLYNKNPECTLNKLKDNAFCYFKFYTVWDDYRKIIKKK